MKKILAVLAFAVISQAAAAKLLTNDMNVDRADLTKATIEVVAKPATLPARLDIVDSMFAGKTFTMTDEYGPVWVKMEPGYNLVAGEGDVTVATGKWFIMGNKLCFAAEPWWNDGGNCYQVFGTPEKAVAHPIYSASQDLWLPFVRN